MKYRWLVVVACLLITACDKPKTEPAKPASGSSTKAESTEKPEAEKTSETKTDAASKTPADQFAAAKAKFNDDRAAFMKLYQAAPAEDRAELVKTKLPQPDDYAEVFLEIANEYPDDDAAADSLVWVAENLRGGDDHDKAIKTLLEKYSDRESLKDLCTSLARGIPSQNTEDNLSNLIEKSPHDSVKAAATFALANFLGGLASTKEFADANPDNQSFDEASRKYLASRGDASETIESLYEGLVADFGDLKTSRGQSYKKVAEAALFEIKYLSIGKVAPDIEGDDMDGKSFKLSDYRGKVVLLDFWGDW